MMLGFGTHASLGENAKPKVLENWFVYPANLPYAWLIPIPLSVGIIISSNANMLKLEATLSGLLNALGLRPIHS